jgi:hypothetical protein
VSRANLEERTIQFLKQHTGGVSKAVWPSSIRRYIATGKSRRRIMILKRLLPLHKLQKSYFIHSFDNAQSFCKGLLARCSCTIHVIIIVVASDIVQMLCVLYSWPILLVMTVVGTVMILIVMHLVSADMEKYHEYGFIFKKKFKAIGLRSEKRCLIESRIADSSQASLRPYVEDEDEEIEQPSVVMPFPDTPMPRTPLIRVMETINLSTTKMEPLPSLQDLSVAKSTIEEHDEHIGVSPQE